MKTRVISRSLLASGAILTLCACPGVQVVSAQAPDPRDCVLVVHTKVSGLAHVADRCWVQAEFSSELGNWQGVGPAPMVLRVEEPQDVYSEIRSWRKAYHRVPPGEMRVRFFYRNELLAEESFPSPNFDEVSLERQTFWGDDEATAGPWPDPTDRPAVGAQKK